MKKWTLVLALVGLSASAAWALEGSLGVFGSYWNPKDADNGWGGGAKLKVELVSPVALELRASYFKIKDEESGVKEEVNVYPLEADLVVNIPVPVPQVTPYVGAGVGYYLFRDGKIKDFPGVGDVGFSADDAVGCFALAGLEIELAPNIALFAEGKYTWVKMKNVKVEVLLDEGSDIKLDGFGANAGLLVKW